MTLVSGWRIFHAPQPIKDIEHRAGGISFRMLAERLWDPPALLPQPKMTLDNVIAAAFTLSRQDRQKLFETIAVADGLSIEYKSTWSDVSEKSANWDAVDKLVRPIKQGLERQKNHGKSYTQEELDALQQIIIKADTDMSYTKSDRLKEMRRIARQYGRDFEAVRNKIQKLRGGK